MKKQKTADRAKTVFWKHKCAFNFGTKTTESAKPTRKRIFSFCFGKKDAVQAGRFVLFFVLTYLVLSIGLELLLPLPRLETTVANNTLSLLQSIGQKGVVEFSQADGTPVIFLEQGARIEISELCTGRMETLIVVAAIIASTGISWRKRIIGGIAAALFSVLFNHARIVVTTLLIINSTDTGMIEFAHNAIFRTVLFLTIAGIYIGWFYWAASTESRSLARKK